MERRWYCDGTIEWAGGRFSEVRMCLFLRYSATPKMPPFCSIESHLTLSNSAAFGRTFLWLIQGFLSEQPPHNAVKPASLSDPVTTAWCFNAWTDAPEAD